MPTKRNLIAILAAIVLGAVALYLTVTSAGAADLGGNCCTDLEERIAELEATAARKGNRKVSLTVYGQVNAGLLYVDVEDFSKASVIQNGTTETFVGFAGAARINGDLAAGYTIELAYHQLGLLNLPVQSSGVSVRQSFWWLKSANLGMVSVGRLAQATQNFDQITTANTLSAAKPLSLGALSDPYLTGIDVPFDGHYRDAVRYDSPTWQGFTLSASWGASVDATASDGNGNAWDAALRYSGDFSGFSVRAGAGYRHDTDLEINILNVLALNLPTGDVNTINLAGSVMHTGSGVFLTANYADQDWKDFGFNLRGYALTGGIEQKWFSIGKTTAYGEWNRFELDPNGGGGGDIDMWGVGLVQAIDAAAMDLYVGYRNYNLDDLGSGDLQTIMAGAKIQF